MKYVNRAYTLSVSKGGNYILFDGTTDEHLRIRFSITHYHGGILSQAVIDIFNLSKKSIGVVSDKYSDITLQAGYRGKIGVIFKGQAINHETRREGTETYVRIYADSGIKDVDVKLVRPRTFNINTPTKEVIEVLVGELGIPYELQDLDDLPLMATGYPISGTVKRELNRITYDHNLEWYIENGKLIVKAKATSVKGNILDISEIENGLIGTPIITAQGIEFDLHLNPGIKLNQLINLKSKSPRIQYSGAFTVNQTDLLSRGTHLVKKIIVEGDSHDNPWFTRCICQKPITSKG